MALNIDKLKEGLREYHLSVTEHIRKLEQDFKQLNHGFHALSQAYGGRAAEELKNDWGKTSKWFDEYTEQTRKVLKTLDERIQALENSNL